ncbi:MAG: hypothetical protein CM15mP103_06290 [Gammaproteobacteria bacterium]|nr:MAG: hypothetical protein CM15mP103_06290 [Gammaproteobacteria bacterium]
MSQRVFIFSGQDFPANRLLPAFAPDNSRNLFENSPIFWGISDVFFLDQTQKIYKRGPVTQKKGFPQFERAHPRVPSGVFNHGVHIAEITMGHQRGLETSPFTKLGPF